MKKALIILWLSAALSAVQAAPTVVAGGKILMTAAPKTITVAPTMATFLRIKVIPGFACKVYIGTPTHDRTTLSGVFAILYPNSVGGHSETWELQDPRNTDGLQLNTIAVSTDCPGEDVFYLFMQTGTTAAGGPLQLLRSGPMSPATVGSTGIWGGSQTTASIIDFRVIPGYVGKMLVRAYGSGIAELFPNTGHWGQNNAHSESYRIVDKGLIANELMRPDAFSVTAAVAGEKLLVTVWRIA